MDLSRPFQAAAVPLLLSALLLPTSANAQTTISGEYHACAILRQQNHAPYLVNGREWRLATHIAELCPSPFALPLEVRTSTFYAPEVQKNYRPSLMVMPDGRFFAGEGPEVFMVHPDYDAASAKMADPHDLPSNEPAEYVPQAQDVVYLSPIRGNRRSVGAYGAYQEGSVGRKLRTSIWP